MSSSETAPDADIPRGKKTLLQEKSGRWHVVIRTVQRWIADDAPINDDVAMAKWLAGRPGLNEETRREVELVRAQHPQEFPIQDPDWVSYQEVRAARLASGAKLPFQTLEGVRDFFAYKLEVRTEAGDRVGADFAMGQLISIDRAIRENQLLDKKLGKELGDTISRELCERWIRSWAFWTVHGIDLVLTELCTKVAAAAQGVTVEQVRAVAEPLLLERRMLIPFARSTRLAAKLAAPAWAVATAKDAVDDYLENGAKLFDEPVAGEETKQPPES